MNDDPHQYAVLILAAGESSRMGSPKPLLPLGRKNFLSHILSNPFLQLEHTHTHVVLGHEPENILSYIPKEVSFSINENYKMGRTTSVQCGLRDFPQKIDGFFLLPVDCPLITPNIFTSIIEAFEDQHSICIPSFQNKRGHPPLIGRAFIEEIMQLKESESLRNIYQNHEDQITHVLVDSESVLHNINTPEDYQTVLTAYEHEWGEE